MGKRKIAYTVDVENGSITFRFGTGPDETVVFNESDVTDEKVRRMALLHGFKQKLVDGFADAKLKPESQTVEAYKADQVLQRINMFIRGDWTLKGEGAVRISMYALALAELTDNSPDEAAKLWSEMDDDRKAKLKAHPGFAAIVARIKMEREKAKLERLEGDATETDTDIMDLIG